MTDAVMWVHGTPPKTPAAFLTAGSAYSASEIDFGAPSTGSSSPYLPQFPSLTEKGYTNPPEVVGQGGFTWGLHLVVGVAFDTLTSVSLEAVSNSTTNATTVIASRVLTLAQLAVAGAHYFVPISGAAILEFLRAHGTLTGSNNVGGTCMMWFGPLTGGEL
jgi:hypothetical protein